MCLIKQSKTTCKLVASFLEESPVEENPPQNNSFCCVTSHHKLKLCHKADTREHIIHHLLEYFIFCCASCYLCSVRSFEKRNITWFWVSFLHKGIVHSEKSKSSFSFDTENEDWIPLYHFGTATSLKKMDSRLHKTSKHILAFKTRWDMP